MNIYACLYCLKAIYSNENEPIKVRFNKSAGKKIKVQEVYLCSEECHRVFADANPNIDTSIIDIIPELINVAEEGGVIHSVIMIGAVKNESED